MDYPVSGKAPNVAMAVVPHAIDGSGNAVPVGAEEAVSLTKGAHALNGASQPLTGVAADNNRKIVIVSNAAGNAEAAIDPTGGAASLTAGLPLGPGGILIFTGKMAQIAMTCCGTNGQSLTVYTG